MKTQVAVASLLAGVAVAAPQPFPPSLLQHPTTPVPDTVDFSMMPSGNFMPSRTSPDAAIPARSIERRANEKVQNGNLARYDSGNTKDGVGSGSDSYTFYSGGMYSKRHSINIQSRLITNTSQRWFYRSGLAFQRQMGVVREHVSSYQATSLTGMILMCLGSTTTRTKCSMLART